MPKSIATKYQVGFVSPYKGWSAADQEAALHAAGVKRIYASHRGETLENAISALRSPGEVIAIAGPLRVFGNARKAIVAAVQAVRAKHYVIVDVLSGMRSDYDGIAMLDAAWKRVNAERRVPDLKKAAEHGAMGGKAKGEAARGRRMPKREALKHWRNPKLTANEALELMHGWTRETAYRYLNERKTPRGRRPAS